MNDITLIVLSAGESTRFIKKSENTKKQWVWLYSKKEKSNLPLWRYVTSRIKSMYQFKHTIITSSPNELKFMQKFIQHNETIVLGGKSRNHSILNALKYVSTKYVLVTDMARACVPKKMIKRIIKSKKSADCIVPILNISDTVIYNNNTIDRNKVKIIQTPQLSKTKILINALQKAIKKNIDFTDDSSAIKANNGLIKYIKGSEKARKITYINDLKFLKQNGCLKPPTNITFNGSGIDIHSFEKNKPAILGGIKIKSDYGFKAHSDGDVLIHSIIDAILGAIGAGDIGDFFPDTDSQYKNINSTILLKNIIDFSSKIGFKLINIDTLIICEIPKITPYKSKIISSLSKILSIPSYKINIKATTSEKMGFIGRKEGIMVKSIATLKYKNLFL